MFVEKLELFGFKSFAQKTEVELSPGFTGIVGPNGCGKSNICDAFRWVLGEQNIRQIRGDSLTDVIFNGTREVRPLGMGEVTLTLNNHDGRLPIEYEHVSIKRRVFRSGESQFFINKTACRLKDIRSLFLDTGLGSFAYSVIHREMVDAVLSEKDDARRLLFEEAAGITRYKVRRRETVLKLEATERNLTRLLDILDVEDRELRSLARQVGKTRRYQKLRNRIKSLEILRAHRRWEILGREVSGLGDAHGEEARRRIALESDVSGKDARIETLQVALLETDRRLDERLAEMESVQEAIRRDSDRILVLKSRGESLEEKIRSLDLRVEDETRRRSAAADRLEELEPRRRALEEEWKGREEKARGAEKSLSELDRALRETKTAVAHAQQRGLAGLEQEARLRASWTKSLERRKGLSSFLDALGFQRGSLSERRRALEDDLCSAREGLALLREDRRASQERLAQRKSRLMETAGGRETVAGDLARLEQEWAAADGRLQLLEEQARTHEGHVAGVRRLLESSAGAPGVKGALGDMISVSPRWVGPVGLALGEMVSWVIVDDMSAARRCMDWLEKDGHGAVTFFPLDAASSGGSGSPRESRGLPAGALDGPEELAPILRFLKDRIHVVGSEDEVPEAARRSAGEFWITGGGRVYGGSGWTRAAGSSIPSQEILKRGPALAELRGKLEAASAQRDALREEERRFAETEAALTAELASLEEDLSDLDRRVGVSDRKSSESDLELRLLGEEEDRIVSEAARVGVELEEVLHDLEIFAAQRERMSRHERFSESRLGALATELKSLEERRERDQDTVSGLRLEALRKEGALREVAAEADRMKEDIERWSGSLESLKEEGDASAKEKLEAAAEVEDLSRSMETLIRKREAVHAAVEEERGGRTRSQDELMALEKEVRALRSDLTRVQDTLRDREVHLAQVRGEREQVRQGILQEYRLDLAQDLPDPLPWSEEEEGLEDEAMEERVRNLRETMETLGPVNILAAADYDEKKERVGFLRSQMNDLEAARASLLEAIETINTRARELFLQTFQQVQEHFQGTFQSLFPGGEARLVLADDDPLEAEIDVQARPRGKRLESIRLLSTGERALTATALLFALYLVKPSPFCILDEVDAPLDDANTRRFVGMLHHFSDRTQFVVITHNKRTMESADLLYGITMEEPGISKVVSVRLRESGELAPTAAGPGAPPAGS